MGITDGVRSKPKRVTKSIGRAVEMIAETQQRPLCAMRRPEDTCSRKAGIHRGLQAAVEGHRRGRRNDHGECVFGDLSLLLSQSVLASHRHARARRRTRTARKSCKGKGLQGKIACNLHFVGKILGVARRITMKGWLSRGVGGVERKGFNSAAAVVVVIGSSSSRRSEGRSTLGRQRGKC